ncbi:voltage gated chloride channel domain-containing protein [Planoprotostelium fungivorum]|uniref:Voltage gated chloride channel domain-containing protein n=1 Tax=Planoprotostelium fungivorum TaxID=1890364 RepID=A0A2P6N4R4_9EUKA|nr:voltage gated chloride channel domain-containing protein [Planoprotostelium fungivorum]
MTFPKCVSATSRGIFRVIQLSSKGGREPPPVRSKLQMWQNAQQQSTSSADLRQTVNPNSPSRQDRFKNAMQKFNQPTAPANDPTSLTQSKRFSLNRKGSSEEPMPLRPSRPTKDTPSSSTLRISRNSNEVKKAFNPLPLPPQGKSIPSTTLPGNSSEISSRTTPAPPPAQKRPLVRTPTGPTTTSQTKQEVQPPALLPKPSPNLNSPSLTNPNLNSPSLTAPTTPMAGQANSVTSPPPSNSSPPSNERQAYSSVTDNGDSALMRTSFSSFRNHFSDFASTFRMKREDSQNGLKRNTIVLTRNEEIVPQIVPTVVSPVVQMMKWTIPMYNHPFEESDEEEEILLSQVPNRPPPLPPVVRKDSDASANPVVVNQAVTNHPAKGQTLEPPNADDKTSNDPRDRANSSDRTKPTSEKLDVLFQALVVAAEKEKPTTKKEDENTICIALYDFQSRTEFELDVRADDEIALLSQEGEWTRGYNVRTKKTGYIPSNYVEETERTVNIRQIAQYELSDSSFSRMYHARCHVNNRGAILGPNSPETPNRAKRQ